MDGIEERLRSHAHAFDSLLELIPAKHYMPGDDNSNQWKKRKQTKEESQRAKKAKLNPDAPTTVKEVLDQKSSKATAATTAKSSEAKEAVLSDQRQKGNWPLKAKETTEIHGRDDEDIKAAGEPLPNGKKKEKKKKKEKTKGDNKKNKKSKPGDTDLDHENENGEELNGGGAGLDSSAIKMNGVTDELELSVAATELGKAITDSSSEPPELSNGVEPAAAADKPAGEGEERAVTKPQIVKDPATQQMLRERLAARIAELRSKRKADSDSQPQNRSELMEQRRQREEARRERKKQIRLQRRAEEIKAANEAARSSPLAESSAAMPKGGSENFQFGQVLFTDGDKLNASLDSINQAKKRKGPTDTAGAIKRVEAKNARLSGMTDEKRAVVLEKDRWNKAHKMVRGEKLQDDESLLRKSMKRQEKAKAKSEKEWNQRKDSVAKSKAAKQKKREDNLAARREQKEAKKSGKKSGKTKPKKPTGKQIKEKNKPARRRAGFEGASFAGGSKKK